MLHSWLKKFSLCLFLVIILHSVTQAAEPVRWQDLTFAIPPQADPFYNLDFDSRVHLETLIEIDTRRIEKKSIDSRLSSKGKAARDSLLSVGLDGQVLLEKYHALPGMIARHRTEIRQDILGKKIQIPGYVVPLEFSEDKITEFLLVPYAGACVHTPPPPSNQIIHVLFSKGIAMSNIDDPFVVEGRLQVDGNSKGVGLSDGQAEFEVGYKLDALNVVPYGS